MSLPVLYDLSLLGFCRDDPAKITGMPRVVLEQAARLATSPDCEVTFCATEDPADAYAFARRHPALQAARLAPLAAPGTDQIDAAALKHARLFHTPHSAVPDEVRRHPSLAVVQTVYDMIPFLLPETMTAEYRAYYGDIIARIKPSDHVITISQSARADFCDGTRHPPDRVHVIPLAADRVLFQPCRDPERIAAVRTKYAIPPGPYLLSVCTFEPRKNLRHIIQSFVALIDSYPHLTDQNLVLAGGRGWMFEPILAELAGTAQLRRRIITTGYVADEDLAPLYSGALAFLYLSIYEGFGLPPLEAMQCGTPSIVSNTSSLPEVVGDAGILLSPTDQDALCQTLLDLCAHPTQRAELSQRSLQQARQFGWERNVASTLEVYRRATQS